MTCDVNNVDSREIRDSRNRCDSDEIRNLEYCTTYRGEKECPYDRGYAARVWMAERCACESRQDTPETFLNFVCAHLGKWDPYEATSLCARYIAEYPRIGTNAKKRVACTYEVGPWLRFQKPRGRSVYEYSVSYCGARRLENLLVYNDGRIYQKVDPGEDPDIWIRTCGVVMTEEDIDPDDAANYQGCMFLLLCKNKRMADAVKRIVEENKGTIDALPVMEDYWGKLEHFQEYFRFFEKRCSGLGYQMTEKGKPAEKIRKRIEMELLGLGCPLGECRNLDEFVNRWAPFFDDCIETDDRRFFYCFADTLNFSRDCDSLGFKMDSFDSLVEKYGQEVLSENSNRPFEKLPEWIDDYQVLGNAIHSKWRDINHWNGKFDPKWFKSALKKLQELR